MTIVSLFAVLASLATPSHAPLHATPAVVTSAASLPLPRLPRLRIPGRSKGPSSSPVDAMDRRLRRFVAQEEAWFVKHARYGNNVSKIAASDASRDAALDLVQVQVLYASKRGWTAIASHPDAPGKSCVVYVGYRETLPLIPRTRTDAKDAMDEGRPSCDSK